tara:strand:- start:823 stop:999 length:177 start_codon:yes stop_codon:yes gene_type:complete
MATRKVKANIVVTAEIDLDEFNVDIDEVSDSVKEYLDDLFYDVEGINPKRIQVRTHYE